MIEEDNSNSTIAEKQINIKSQLCNNKDKHLITV